MYDKLLICVTGSKNSAEVARVGLSCAGRNAQVIFLHVVTRLDEQIRVNADKELSHIKTILMERPPVRTEFVVLEGDPKQKIMELAQKNQVSAIVVGEVKEHSGESISDYLLHHAKTVVISVKSKEQ
ncbi:MAG TPA: universal stress protein [Candidatus Nanoarchaeia archaeon]|nr:universal stress protein [Candidatus Nanoarchaeia archaeon]